MRQQLYRLPSGDITSDVTAWSKAWNVLGVSIAKLFPGYHLAGMDPGITLHPDDWKGDSVQLPVKACHALLSKVK